MTDIKQRKAIILKMLEAFPSAANLGTETVTALAQATVDYSLEAVHYACQRFVMGDVAGRDNDRMPPSAAELMPQVRMIEAGLQVRQREPLPPGPDGYRRLPTGEIIVPIGAPLPAGFDTCGDVEVDFGHGKIDLRGKSKAEREEIYRLGGLPPIKKIDGARPLPMLRRMA